MRFGSVCSGIEAASVAWEPLGWEAAWFSEIDAFPSAVLAHHWPKVPNLGDMMALPARVASGEVEAPDVLVGGTPCQAFSVAGNRESLSDARGNLTLTYVELADAIDRQRIAQGEQPAIIVWENVPGVLSTKDNAFGCFLAGLAGEDVPLQPSGRRWTNAGLVLGPKRAVAWRILDAQYFGVAQRRRRVFVVASARNGFDPSAILFEFDGVRRDSPPRREARQEIAGDAGSGASGAGGQRPYHDVALCLNAGGMGRIDYESESMVVSVTGDITHALNTANNGKGSSEDGTGRGVPTIAFHPTQDPISSVECPHALGTGSSCGCATSAVTVPILEAGARTGKSTTDPRAGIGIGADGDPMYTLQAGKQHAVAAQTVALRGRDGGATAELGGEVATALRASSGGGDKPHVLAFQERGRADGRSLETNGDLAYSLTAPAGGGRAQERNIAIAAPAQMAVRRLTPMECERLQGFPDDHTLVPHRGKDAADGPRYKALGNSMAVPVMHWIGKRIAAYLA